METKKLKFTSLSLFLFLPIFLFLCPLTLPLASDAFIFSPLDENKKMNTEKKGDLQDLEEKDAFIYKAEKEEKGLKSLKGKKKESSEEDFDPFINKGNKDDTRLGLKNKNKKEDPFYLDNESKSPLDTSLSEEEKMKDFSSYLPGSVSQTDFSKSLPFLKKHSHADFYFRYFYDNFKYTKDNKDSVFKRTYRESSDSSSPFLFQIGGGKLFPTSLGNWGVGSNLGFSYSSGKGHFKNADGSPGDTSDVFFRFWTIPLDLKFSYDMVLGSFLRLGVAGGPSVIGVIQNRSDLKDNSTGKKNVRRFGYGYFYEATLKFELLGLFSDEYRYKMFHQYDMTNTFLTVTYRGQEYSRFSRSQSKLPKEKESLKISGASWGIGMCYEFF